MDESKGIENVIRELSSVNDRLKRDVKEGQELLTDAQNEIQELRSRLEE